MQYMIAFYERPGDFATRAAGDESFWLPWRQYFADIRAAGIQRAGFPLEEPERAVTTRVRAGGPVVQDGPYADTKEQLGGFVVIDVPTLDDALTWAERAPAARSGAVEVRPVVQMGDDAGAPDTAPRSAMKFMLGIFESAEDFASREGPDAERYWGAWGAYATALREAGVVAGGSALREPGTATVVRVNGGARTVHDGPYADTKEQLGGYLVLDVPTMDDALAWAARCPAAFTGALEVRPVLRIGAPA